MECVPASPRTPPPARRCPQLSADLGSSCLSCPHPFPALGSPSPRLSPDSPPSLRLPLAPQVPSILTLARQQPTHGKTGNSLRVLCLCTSLHSAWKASSILCRDPTSPPARLSHASRLLLEHSAALGPSGPRGLPAPGCPPMPANVPQSAGL